MGKHILVRSEELRERIEEYIDKSGLKPGDKLPSERAFAEALGTSRVTLRDALIRMQDEGLIETRHEYPRPSKGIIWSRLAPGMREQIPPIQELWCKVHCK